MSRRFIIISMVVMSMAMLCGVAVQRRELLKLRVEPLVPVSEENISTNTPTIAPANEQLSSTNIRELLQLRNQAAQLRRQRDELLPVRAEHQALVEQFAIRGTNVALPPNYIRKSEARMVGYKSPEETLQSFLYSLRVRDVQSLLEACTPEVAARLKDRAPGSPNSLGKFLEDGQAIVGLGIVSQMRQAEGHTIVAETQLLPGIPPTQIIFRLINDQWKIDSLP